MKELGVYKNISNEDYHAAKEYVSRSALMDFDKSPYTYWAKHINPDRPKKDATPQMEFGSLVHTCILEDEKFRDQYIVEPYKILLKDVGREAYEDYKEKLEATKKSGKIVISNEDFHRVYEIKEKLFSNSKAVDLLYGRIENSFFWKDEHSGLFVKARPDVLHDNMYVDLKTTSDASPRHYQSEMVKFGYHIQGAMVKDAVMKLEGKEIKRVINIVIETKYPYNMGIYIIDDFAIEEGHMKYKQLLLDLKNALDLNNFKDYGTQIIGLPKWAI